MIGLADRSEPKNFFVYLSIVVTFAILMSAQLAFFASFASAGQLQVYSSCILLAMMLFGGFIIPPNVIPQYFLWVYWWNPFAWAYRGLIVNEFRSLRWNNPDQILIDAGFANGNGRPYGQHWIGWSFAFMIPYFILCCFLSIVSLTYARSKERVASESNGGATKSTDGEGHKVEIPFKPATLSFTNLCYTVKSSTSNEQLTLLHQVNGMFRPGQMCALMVCA
jgi:ABC-2 type transporter